MTTHSRIIELNVAYLDNQFYPVAIDKLSHALLAQDYNLPLSMASNDPNEMDRLTDDLRAYQVDRIITAPVAISNDVTRRCAEAAIPLVMFNRGQPVSGPSPIPSVNAPDGRKVAQFLIRTRHQRIARISGWQGASTEQDRARGLLDARQEEESEPAALVDGMFDRDKMANDRAEPLVSARSLPSPRPASPSIIRSGAKTRSCPRARSSDGRLMARKTAAWPLGDPQGRAFMSGDGACGLRPLRSGWGGAALRMRVLR